MTTTPPKKRISRRGFLKALGQLAIGTGAGAIYTAFVEPAWAEVVQIEIKLPRLPTAFAGFRLAQISDVHFGSWMTRERFLPALDLLFTQNPDALAITGDFVYGNWDAAFHGLDSVTNVFTTLAKRIPTFAVLGNHDHWTDPEMVRRFLHDTGIRELRNDVHAFKKAGQQLYLCGVDDIWEKKNDLKAVTAKLSHTDCAILMAHEPDFADQSAASGFFDLQISGHSHGGQVVIPFYGPPMLPWLGTKYHTGLYQVGEMSQYTNRGLGMISPPVRFNCRPEITIFSFV